MEKPRFRTSYEEPTDALDLSYVELQEYDSLETQSQEFSSVLKEEQE